MVDSGTANVSSNNPPNPGLAERSTLHTLVSSAMLSEFYTQDEALDFLRDCMQQARNLGIPFSHILQLEIEPIGVTPLEFELLRCQVDPFQLDLLCFLLTHTGGTRTDWYVQRGCLARGSDGAALYQIIQQFLKTNAGPPEDPPTFVVDSETLDELNAHISIPSFADTLKQLATPHSRQMPGTIIGVSSKPQGASREPLVEVKWISNGRLWLLLVGSNSLELRLVDGSPATVDARVTVQGQPRHAQSSSASAGASAILLPKLPLVPLSQSGVHSTALKPCFSSFGTSSDTPTSFERAVDHGALVLQFHLSIQPGAPEHAETDASAAPPVTRVDAEDDWDDMYVDDPPPSAETDDAGWVKASWSGRDEDL